MADERRPETSVAVPELVKPLVTPEQAAEQWKRFEELKAKLLIPLGKENSDYQGIRVKERQPDGSDKYVEKAFIKRSGFRKLAVFFGLTDRIVEQERTDRTDRSFMWRIVVEVQSPGGRVSTGVGICDSKEAEKGRQFFHLEHDVYATAHTRGKNRAISDMIAGGVVSAEEAEEAVEEHKEEKKIGPERIKEPDLAKPTTLPTSLEEVEYRLGEHVLELDKTLSVTGVADGFKVEPKQFLEEEVWRMITDIIREMGGEWVPAGKNSYWKIPKG